MSRRSHRPRGGARGPRPLTPVTAALLLVVASATAAPAGTESEAAAAAGRSGGNRGAWLSIGLLGGTTQLSHGLADYQWNTTPRPSWGAQVLAGRNRFAAGLRLWRTQTTQAMGDLVAAPTVRATSWELVGEGLLAEAWGARLLATAGVGWLHLGYQPDEVTIQPSGAGAPIVVDLAPADEWIAGGGLALRRSLVADWTLGLAIDARVFGLEAAHRVGDTVVVERESFGDWSARVELARLYRRR